MTRLEWFKSRVGKKVFRQKTGCCKKCNEGYENGVDIADEFHAEYLYEMEGDFHACDEKMMYFETKQQADNYDAWVTLRKHTV